MKAKFTYEEDYQEFRKIIIEINGNEYHLSEEFDELVVLKVGANASTDRLYVHPQYSNSLSIK